MPTSDGRPTFTERLAKYRGAEQSRVEDAIGSGWGSIIILLSVAAIVILFLILLVLGFINTPMDLPSALFMIGGGVLIIGGIIGWVVTRR